MTTNNIKTLQTFDTVYASDSVEWCPIVNFQKFFLCGTYELDKSADTVADSNQISTKRKGKLYLFNFSEETENFNLLSTYETSAVLDIKWFRKTQPIAGVCNSIGDVEIFEINDLKELTRKEKITLNCELNENLALALDWNIDDTKLIVSDSKGNLNLFDFNGVSFIKLNSWQAHEFEAWTCAFDTSNCSIVYSGMLKTIFLIYFISKTQIKSTPSEFIDFNVVILL